METIILERQFSPPLSVANVLAMFTQARDCMRLHQLQWQASYLATSGTRMICHFNGPDAETLRSVMRQFNMPYMKLWSATVHEGKADQQAARCVAVERDFRQATAFAAVQAMEDAVAWCLDLHRVSFTRSFFSLDHKRMICLYNAPDTESVRITQRKGKMPVTDLWGCVKIEDQLHSCN